MPFQIFFLQFRPATWFTTTEAIGLPLAFGIAAALGTIAAQILVGIVTARPLLRAQGVWARLVLHIEDTEQWRRRAAALEATPRGRSRP